MSKAQKMINRTLLFIGNFLPSPKHNKNVWHFLVEHLQKAGWSVITTSNQERQLPRLVDMLSAIWRKRDRYQAAHIDIFSGKAFIYAWLTTWLLKLVNKRIAVTLHGGGLPEFSKKHPYMFTKYLRLPDIVVTPSPFLHDSFKHIRSDIKIIPNPIDLTESLFRLRDSIKPRLIWVRAFHSVYNPALAIKVLARVAQSFPEAKLWMLGPDKGDHSLASVLDLAEELGVTQSVEIVGHVSHANIPIWLDKADIFLNTSNYDTAPRSLLEAMANGLCVISTNVGGIPYLAENGMEAILVDPNDPGGMADAVIKTLSSPSLATTLSRNARARAEKSDWSAILPSWELLFSDLLDQP